MEGETNNVIPGQSLYSGLYLLVVLSFPLGSLCLDQGLRSGGGIGKQLYHYFFMISSLSPPCG